LRTDTLTIGGSEHIVPNHEHVIKLGCSIVPQPMSTAGAGNE
jgi:hypothetical protein